MNAKPTIPLNEGRYNINYEVLKAQSFKANFGKKQSVQPRE